jgi:drug/metabolite transporter (DMT)-like permease
MKNIFIHAKIGGAGLALAAAVLFGLSTPAAKLLVSRNDPWVLAGLLYFSSGIALLLIWLVGRLLGFFRVGGVRGADWLWLAGAILAGGVAGPVLLMLGLVRTQAATASLLLNLEGILTAGIAWMVFRENVDRRIAFGMTAIVAGALVLSWRAGPVVVDAAGPMLIAAAGLAWAIDNNLTRQVSHGSPLVIAMLKGLVAGPINIGIGLWLGALYPTLPDFAAAAIVGIFGYGFSLMLFVLALRGVGTARTGAYFATAPFVGAAVAVLVLGDPLTWQLALAGALMAIGVWLHLTERHEHEHVHKPLTHTHRHRHDDDHHDHHHPADEEGSASHSHRHTHPTLVHRHPHYPDLHHRHRHRG